MKDTKNYLVRVGEGYGFAVRGKESYVITAASLLPDYLENEHDMIFPEVLGPIGAEPKIPAVCTFINEAANVAVLSSVKAESFSPFVNDFSRLLETVTPLSLINPPELSRNAYRARLNVSVLWPDKKTNHTALCRNESIWLMDGSLDFSLAGCPVLHNKHVIAAVTISPQTLEESIRHELPQLIHGCHREPFAEGGINPVLSGCLPPWLLEELKIAAAPVLKETGQGQAVGEAQSRQEKFGFADGLAFHKDHGIAGLPSKELKAKTLLFECGPYESNLDRLPSLPRKWILNHLTPDKALHDERDSYLSGFCLGGIAAENEREERLKAEREALSKVRIVHVGGSPSRPRTKLVKTAGPQAMARS